MRLIYRTLLLFFLLVPAGIAALLWFGLDSVPLVETAAPLSTEDVARARQILQRNDPRRLEAGTPSTLTLEEKDLNLAANYLAKKYGEAGVDIRIKPDHMVLKGAIRLPARLFHPYLNLILILEKDQAIPRMAGLYLGRIQVPSRLAETLIRLAWERTFNLQERGFFQGIIQELALAEGMIRISYEWQPELLSQVQAQLASPEERERLRVYHQELVRITAHPELGQRASLLQLLQPMFQYARLRTRENDDPAAENRALILVLAAYMGGSEIEALLPRQADLPPPRRLILTLQRRQDFAEHFTLSAALAVAGDAALADAVGLYKELADAQGSSGFSFTDLAADRTGTRFGETATASRESALHVQAMLAGDVAEADIMPPFGDLPEHMSRQEFKQRFDRIDSPAFQALKQQIEQRIAACRLYR